MFSKLFRKEQKKGNDEDPLKKGKKGWALSQKPIPQYQVLVRWKEGLQGYMPQVQQRQEMPWASSGLHAGRNKYLQSIHWKM